MYISIPACTGWNRYIHGSVAGLPIPRHTLIQGCYKVFLPKFPDFSRKTRSFFLRSALRAPKKKRIPVPLFIDGASRSQPKDSFEFTGWNRYTQPILLGRCKVVPYAGVSLVAARSSPKRRYVPLVNNASSSNSAFSARARLPGRTFVVRSPIEARFHSSHHPLPFF